MKKLSLLIILLILLAGARKQLPEAPSGLMVEFIRETAGIRILDPSPEFSWIVPVSTGTQTAFQILVSSSMDLLKKDTGDKWDSGRSSGSQSTEVEMRGNPLSGETTYHWKVRIWDLKDRPSQYSEIHSFTTGKFNGYATTVNKFTSKMIGPEKVVRKGPGHYFGDGEFSQHSSLHANMTPLAFGLVPDEYRDSVITFIKSRELGASLP